MQDLGDVNIMTWLHIVTEPRQMHVFLWRHVMRFRNWQRWKLPCHSWGHRQRDPNSSVFFCFLNFNSLRKNSVSLKAVAVGLNVAKAEVCECLGIAMDTRQTTKFREDGLWAWVTPASLSPNALRMVLPPEPKKDKRYNIVETERKAEICQHEGTRGNAERKTNWLFRPRSNVRYSSDPLESRPTFWPKSQTISHLMIVHPKWIDAIHALKKFGHCHYLTWKVAISYLIRSWESHAEATQQVQKLFGCYRSNAGLKFDLLCPSSFSWVGWQVSLPSISASFGCSPCCQHLSWVYATIFTNFAETCGNSNHPMLQNGWTIGQWPWPFPWSRLLGWPFGMCCYWHWKVCCRRHGKAMWLFPWAPLRARCKNSILLLYALGLALVMTCPVWCEGYRVVQELLERDFRLSKAEALMEIAYTTSQLAACLQLQTALAMIQVGFGFPFHFIHFAAVITEHIFFHRMVQFKFAWLHKLFHEVQPLHRLVHLEHHICKGTYPTTPAAGLWEGWLCGGTLFFCNTLACVPYLFFHAVYSGPNAVIHTMWPHKFCIQWHTLHHLANSDIYAANVPSENDKKFSRDVQKYKEKMKCSVFTRYSSASDVAGFAMSLIVGVIVHYTCGIGLFHTWKESAFRFTGWSRASGRIHLTEPA